MEIIQLGQIALIYLQVWADRSHFLLSDKKWGSVKALRWNSHINYECAAHPGADEAALSPTFVKVQVVTTGSLVVALVSSILKCFHICSQFQAYYVYVSKIDSGQLRLVCRLSCSGSFCEGWPQISLPPPPPLPRDHFIKSQLPSRHWTRTHFWWRLQSTQWALMPSMNIKACLGSPPKSRPNSTYLMYSEERWNGRLWRILLSKNAKYQDSRFWK